MSRPQEPTGACPPHGVRLQEVSFAEALPGAKGGPLDAPFGCAYCEEP